MSAFHTHAQAGRPARRSFHRRVAALLLLGGLAAGQLQAQEAGGASVSLEFARSALVDG